LCVTFVIYQESLHDARSTIYKKIPQYLLHYLPRIPILPHIFRQCSSETSVRIYQTTRRDVLLISEHIMKRYEMRSDISEGG